MDYSEDIDYRSFRSKCKLCLETLLEQEKENNVTSDVEKKIFEIFPSNVICQQQTDLCFNTFLFLFSYIHLEICRACCATTALPRLTTFQYFETK